MLLSRRSILLLPLLAAAARPALAAAKPFPHHTAYAQGTLLPSHVTRQQMDDAVARHYAAWKLAYLGSDANGSFVLYDEAKQATVSEAHGYGMVLAAYMGEQPLFNSMFSYFKAHPSVLTPRLMAWKQTLVNGQMVNIRKANSATDGDLDIAYALLLAHVQWGSASTVNYRAEALKLTQAILNHEVNQTTVTLKVGDWATGTNSRYTRSSDFMTGHLLAFAKYDTANAAKWRALHNSIVRIVNHQFRNGSGKTGLMPDFMVKSGANFVPVPGKYIESKHDGDNHYNACRTAWRTPMSYLLHGRHGMKEVFRTQSRWIRTKTGGKPARIRAGYYVRNGINGKAYANHRDLAFTAPYLVTAVAAGAGNQAWINALWDSITGNDFGLTTGYFGDSIRMQVLLVASGNWWAP